MLRTRLRSYPVGRQAAPPVRLQLREILRHLGWFPTVQHSCTNSPFPGAWVATPQNFARPCKYASITQTLRFMATWCCTCAQSHGCCFLLFFMCAQLHGCCFPCLCCLFHSSAICCEQGRHMMVPILLFFLFARSVPIRSFVFGCPGSSVWKAQGGKFYL